MSSGDQVDVLVAFNEEAYETHADEVREGGVIIYNADDFTMTDPRSFGLAVDTLARSTGNNRAANMVVIGALAQLVHMPQEYLEDFVEARFRRGRANDDEIIESNIQAMRLGRQNAAESGFVLGDLAPPQSARLPATDAEGQRGYRSWSYPRRSAILRRLSYLPGNDYPAVDGAQPGGRW